LVSVLLGFASLSTSLAFGLGRCSALVADLVTVDDLERERPRIETRLRRDGFEPAERYAHARLLLDYFDVRETPEFRKLPIDERLVAVNAVCADLAKLPAAVREANRRAGFATFLVVDNIVEHPRMGAYANRRPRGHPKGTTWKAIAGAGSSAEAPGAIVAVRKLAANGQNHGCTNLLLHEVGHNFDAAWGQLHWPEPRTWRERWEAWWWGRKLSSTPAWRKIHSVYVWPSRYEQKYPEEALVEAIARYYDSPATRENLRRYQPEAFEFIEREVDGYREPIARF
jgi:hypothetical protein